MMINEKTIHRLIFIFYRVFLIYQINEHKAYNFFFQNLDFGYEFKLDDNPMCKRSMIMI